MPPKVALAIACQDGSLAEIEAQFQRTPSVHYRVCLSNFVSFLKHNLPEKNDFEKIKAYRKILQLFFMHLKQSPWDEVVKLVRDLSSYYPPGAKTIFRQVLKQSGPLYLLTQPKKKACSRKSVTTQQRLHEKINFNAFLKERRTDFLCVDYPRLQFFYNSHKTKRTKWVVDMGREHIDLKAALSNVDDGNVAVSALTFMLKITGATHSDRYEKITLPVLISTDGSLESPALHFDHLAQRIPDAYQQLRILFNQGLSYFKVTKYQHGHDPQYETPDAPRAADSIKHCEQGLALYLSEQKNVSALLKQLIDKLRTDPASPAQLGDCIKFIAVILHFHSQKTPCAVCETVLAGLMFDEENSFLGLLKSTLTTFENPYYTFRLPKKGIRLHTLYSADTYDADHKSYEYTNSVLNVTCQSMRNPSICIYLALIRNGLSRDYRHFVSPYAELEISVLSSGGDASEIKRHTLSSANAVSQKKQSIVSSSLFHFGGWIRALEASADQAERRLQEKYEQYDCFIKWLGQKWGIEKKSILGDGNCQFAAIAEQLIQIYGDYIPGEFYKKDKTLVESLRLLTVEYLNANRAKFEGFLTREDFSGADPGPYNFDHYLRALAQNAYHSGALGLRVLSQITNLPIFVLHPDLMQQGMQYDHRIFYPDGFQQVVMDSSQYLIIIYDDIGHYDTISVRPEARFFEQFQVLAPKLSPS